MSDTKETRLKLAQILLIEAVKAGASLSTQDLVKNAFKCVDQYEKEAIKRNLIISDVCPECKVPIRYFETGHTFTTRCDCPVNSEGNTKEEAQINHIKKALENA